MCLSCGWVQGSWEGLWVAALSWHHQSFAKVFCHLCSIFVLCSCSVTSLSVPPELWSESCCHPTPEQAGICHPLLAGIPAALGEVSQAPALCRALAHPAHPEGTFCSARALLCPCPWLSLWLDVPVPLGRAAVKDCIPTGQYKLPAQQGSKSKLGRLLDFIFTIAVGKPGRSAEPWQRGGCCSPTLSGGDMSACVLLEPPGACN